MTMIGLMEFFDKSEIPAVQRMAIIIDILL